MQQVMAAASPEQKDPKVPTRLDILFQDVRAMEVRAWFDGIRIEEAEPQYLEKQASKPDELIEPGTGCIGLLVPAGRGSLWAESCRFRKTTKSSLPPANC